MVYTGVETTETRVEEKTQVDTPIIKEDNSNDLIKYYAGRIQKKIPKILEDGRVPLSSFGLMQQRNNGNLLWGDCYIFTSTAVLLSDDKVNLIFHPEKHQQKVKNPYVSTTPFSQIDIEYLNSLRGKKGIVLSEEQAKSEKFLLSTANNDETLLEEYINSYIGNKGNELIKVNWPPKKHNFTNTYLVAMGGPKNEYFMDFIPYVDGTLGQMVGVYKKTLENLLPK